MINNIIAATFYHFNVVSGQLQQSGRRFRWYCYDRNRRETGEQDLSIHTRVLVDHWSCNQLVFVIGHERPDCTRLRDKKHFDHGFHRGILVRGCNGD